MGVLDVVDASGLFTTSANQGAQLEGFAQRTLTKALELFTAERYAEAIPVFKRAIGLAPRTSTALNAFDYMARSHLALDDSKSAIDTYQQSLRLAPDQAPTHMALGRIHFDQSNYDDALDAYTRAVKLDPSAGNRYALGQTLMELGRYDDAERQFLQVRQQSPGKADGDFGLGLVYARQGQNEAAVDAFRQAIEVEPKFWFGYEEMGFVLADMGELEQAGELVLTLINEAPELAVTLSRYISQKTPPEMQAVYSTSTFLYTLGPRTAVANLGDYLTDPGSQRTFSMVFQFSKDMDAMSVENVVNWEISRSLDTGRGDGYNFSLPMQSTEVSLDPYPTSVTYDAEERTATVLFVVRQNDAGDGTLDPSHIKFKFSGADTDGQALNSKADEYTGFSGFA